MSSEENELMAVFQTVKGEIRVKLFPGEAPLTVANFVNLATRKYYDGLKFHRVIANFMIQGGDPDGTGMGGPGYNFPDEFSPLRRHDSSGVLSMANAGPGTNGSQFFIMHGDMDLPKNYTIFGMVVEGQEVVDRIAKASVKATMAGELSVPVSPVTIQKISISDSARE